MRMFKAPGNRSAVAAAAATSLRATRPVLQRSRLTVSQPSDAHEQEADRIADVVMGGGGVAGAEQRAPRGLHRSMGLFPDDAMYDSTLPGGAVEPDGRGEEEIQRSAEPGASAGSVTAGFDGALSSELSRGGEPLPPATRSFMESRMGWDFSAIRIHHDQPAAELARGVSARAFTVGNDVFFGRSEYRPERADGRRLLAHELVHAMQQSEGRVARKIQRTVACSEYPGYRAAEPISGYNCAGLALRTYTFISPSSTVPTAIYNNFKAPNSPLETCGAGSVKFWHWEYDLHVEDDRGNSSPAHPDFHIVGARMGATGAEPTNVYSKNGHRPVHGPASGPSWRPPDRERATSDDAAESPVSTPDGHPVFKVRTNRTDWIYCADCA